MPPILTLKDLQELTPAYKGFTNIVDSDLPDYYKSIFPHKCKCGAEIIMTAGGEYSDSKYTQLQCCNPDCWLKMAHRFSYFCSSLGYKGFGPNTSMAIYERIYRTFPYPSFLCIFDASDSDILSATGDAYLDSFYQLKYDLLHKQFQFKDAIAALGIPNVGKNCKIFDAIKAPMELAQIVLQRKTADVCYMVGIHASSTIWFLDNARLDIALLVTTYMPHILTTPNKEIYVAITGSVTVDDEPLTRQEFIHKCESLKDSKGVTAFKLVETKAAGKLDFVIADSPSNSSKYTLGQKLGNLITAQGFYNWLKESIGGESSG